MPKDQVEQTAADTATGEDTGAIEVFMAGSLLANVGLLARMAQHGNTDSETVCFCGASLLTAAAALEAFLAEFAFKNARADYTKQYRKWGVPDKYEKLTGFKLRNNYPAVLDLWEYRIALCHSEPDNDRSRSVGKILNPAGANWAYTTVQEFTRGMLGGSTPDWFRVA